MEQRPEATSFQLDRLLVKVLEGQVRVPHFQRGLRWKDDDRIQLFSSIYRGYPIGTLLLWKRPGPEATVTLGRLTVIAPKRDDVLWLVDGQQRVTTLAEALLGNPVSTDRSLHFDLDEEEFVYIRQARRIRHDDRNDGSRWLPLAVVLDSSKLLDWLLDHDLDRTRRDRAIEVGKRIREYQVPAYVVEADDEQVLRTIFDRTNRTGRRLDDTEVFEALYGSMTTSQPARLEDVAGALDGLGFGRIEASEVLDAFHAIEGLPLHEDFTGQVDRKRVPAALRSTEAALRRAVTFLQRDAGIPHRELLPYTLLLTVLSLFFHRFPEPLARSRTLLRRWAWRGSLAMKLTGATVGLRQHLDCVQKGDEEGSVQQLLAMVTEPARSDVLRLDDFNRGKARTRLQACALAALGPRDVRTGSLLDLSSLLSSPEDAFPSIVARKPGAPARVTGLANRLIHSKLPPADLQRILGACGEPEILASHGIPLEARDALRAGDIERFLALREEHLAAVTKTYFERQAERGADDTPSIASMIVEDDD